MPSSELADSNMPEYMWLLAISQSIGAADHNTIVVTRQLSRDRVIHEEHPVERAAIIQSGNAGISRSLR